MSIDLRFHLDHFDGPMDLLMHLLEKNSIDVYNIPISVLADQYMEYVEEAESMNLEIASHFLMMAAQLIRIKTKMLLPKKKTDPEEDPRKPLVDQIVAYKYFKELSSELEEIHQTAMQYRTRDVDVSALEKKYHRTEPLENLDVDILMKAFAVLKEKKLENQRFMVVERTGFSIDELRQKLLALCMHEKKMIFQSILELCHYQEEKIVYFLALLECIHQNEIITIQHENFGDIWMYVESDAG